MEIATWATQPAFHRGDVDMQSAFAMSEFCNLGLAERSILTQAVTRTLIHGDPEGAHVQLNSIVKWPKPYEIAAVGAIMGEPAAMDVRTALATLVAKAPPARDIDVYVLSTLVTQTRRWYLHSQSRSADGSEMWAARRTAIGHLAAELKVTPNDAPKVMGPHDLAPSEIRALTECLSTRMRVIESQKGIRTIER